MRLYADTGPHTQRVTRLQKGLTLVSNGTELCGEGIGLGVPAVRYRNRTYFSGFSTVEYVKRSDPLTVKKKFTLNLSSERTLGNIHVDAGASRRIRRGFDELYMNHRHLRLLIFESLLRRIGVRTDFVQSEPVGNVAVTYSSAFAHIHVKAEFNLPKEAGIQKTFLFNEQGFRHFRKYHDSTGAVLFDNDIGAWETVNADWACMYSVEDKVGFRLWKHEQAVLYRGREFLNGIFDWAGLDYEVEGGKTHFEYDIELVGGKPKR